MNADARKIVDQLSLIPLPDEGGFFRQTWLSETRHGVEGRVGSAIYFLVTEGDFSALHRLTTDEIWHFYAGDPVSHLQLNAKTGEPCVTLLGGDVLGGHTSQLVVAGGIWQGARLAASISPSKGWALLGCTMAPAWDQRGFTLGSRDELTRIFPRQPELVAAFTR